MFDSSTLYLILVMAAFIAVAIVLVHHHNCADQVRQKKNEVKALIFKYQQRIDVLEQKVIDLQMEIDEVDEEIELLQG